MPKMDLVALLLLVVTTITAAFSVGWRAPVKRSSTLEGVVPYAAATAADYATVGSTVAQNPLSLKDQLERQFNATMQRETVPLFKDFDTYYESMPVREHLYEYMRLCELPYWAADEDVKFVSECLSSIATDRRWVWYLAAPSKSGKTSCAVPVFLQGALAGNFTHYVYLACSNNHGRDFTLDPPNPAANLNTAEDQGAAFALDFIKVLFETAGDRKKYRIPLNDAPPSVGVSTTDLDEYLKRKLGPDARVLIHVDEHSKMCHREGKSAESGARFAKGALEALASSKILTVLATMTERPPVSPEKSSAVCRRALPAPLPDVNQIMAEIPELRPLVRRHELDPQHESAWAILRFRLGSKLTELGLASLHVRTPETNLFLKNFEAAALAATPDLLPVYLECINLCDVKLGNILLNPNAAALLLGEADTDIVWDRQVSNLVIVRQGSEQVVSATFQRLLAWHDPMYEAYNDGRDRLRGLLQASYKKEGASAQAVLSTPLEALFSWSLSCRSAVYGRLRFGPACGPSLSFKIKCEELLAERLFPKTDNSKYNTSKAQPGKMYFAKEGLQPGGDSFPSHPLADIFFRTSSNQLVLVDITGGNDGDDGDDGDDGNKKTPTPTQKAQKLADWIQREQGKNDEELCGVVLAPFAEMDGKTEFVSSTTDSDDSPARVLLVRGDDARMLLGGLDQANRWLVD